MEARLLLSAAHHRHPHHPHPGALAASSAAPGSAALVFTPAATGMSTTSFAAVPITAGAIADDPQLNNRVTSDMQVTIPTGADWTNSEIKIQLTQGTIYNASGAAGTDASPNPASWATVGSRQGQFDTFVTAKNFAPAILLGKFPSDGSGPAVGLTANNAALLSAAWGDTTSGEEGTFTVGRFTLSADAVGTFQGHSFSSGAPGVAENFAGTISSGNFTIAPPGGLTITGTAGDDTFRLVSHAGDPTMFDVTVNGLTTTYTKALIPTISVSGLGGNDTLTVDFSGGNPVVASGLVFDGGSANDTLIVKGSSATESLVSSGTQVTFAGATINYTTTEAIGFDTGGGGDSLSANGATPVDLKSPGGSPAGPIMLSSLTIGPGALVRGSAAAPANQSPIVVTTLSIDPTGLLDLRTSPMIVKTTSGAQATAIEALVALGFNGGDYGGKGITSSSAAANPASTTTLGVATAGDIGVATFANQTVSATDTLLKYTYYGDFDLSGSTTGDDEQLVLTGLRVAGTPQKYVFGDADFSGHVNGDDYSLFLAGLRKSPPL
jgi:hypothetical protein